MSSFLKSNGDTTDVQILEKINRGDLEVFRYMYLEYYSSLCIYARKFTGTKESAEEIVQDVFISLWERQGFLRINRSVKSYLFISVRNLCLNYLKHLQVVNKFNEFYSNMLHDAQDYYFITQETGDSHLIARELEDRINEEIEKLPEKCREIFLLSRVEHLKHKEIANKLGLSINTIHRQVSIAIERIRKGIEKLLILVFLLIVVFTR